MKNTLVKVGLIAGLLFPGLAHATLVDRGGGLIYDDVLDITWLQDANYAMTSGYDVDGRMNRPAADTWALNLSYGGFDDWRLPMLRPVAGMFFEWNFSTDGSTDVGYGQTGVGWETGAGEVVSEMGWMFYGNLGNLGYCPPDGGDANPATCDSAAQAGWGLTNTGPFDNLQSNWYWFTWAPEAINCFGCAFNFNVGLQDLHSFGNEFFAWAVRDGDVASVPEPATLGLLSLGLAGLASARRRARRRA